MEMYMLTEFGSDLVSTLTSLDMNDFSHFLFCSIITTEFEFITKFLIIDLIDHWSRLYSIQVLQFQNSNDNYQLIIL